MNYKEKYNIINSGKTLYLHLPIENATARYFFENGNTREFLKLKGTPEVEILEPEQSKLIFEIWLSGVPISEEFYNQF